MNSRKAVGTNSDATELVADPAPPKPKQRPLTGPLTALKDLERMQFGELDRTSRD